MAGLERGVWKTMLVTGLLAVVALGCGGDADVATREESAAGGAPGVGYADAVELFATPEEAPAAFMRVPGAASPQASTPARPRMLIRSGTAVVEVDAIDTSVEAVRLLAERMGGFLAGVNVSGGSDVTRAASLTLRSPADRWDETLAALDSLGEVESVYISTEDVGETYADLEVRVANARRLEERLLDLLATRTGSLEDVLAVERELARVREEI